MRVLGIDPGFDRLGLAVLEGDPSRPIHIWSDCVIPPKGTQDERLAVVHEAVADAIRTYAPDLLALETLYFSTNKSSAMGVAEARGVVLSAAGEAGIKVSEHAPGSVKLSVTGSGRADKKMIAIMIPKLLTLPAKKRLDDELDAIAIAITALSTSRHV